jgi:hypothetical protein
MGAKPMHDGSPDQYTLIERFLISLMIGFAFVLGYALYELDALAKNLDSSLAAIATIGGSAF